MRPDCAAVFAQLIMVHKMANDEPRQEKTYIISCGTHLQVL